MDRPSIGASSSNFPRDRYGVADAALALGTTPKTILRMAEACRLPGQRSNNGAWAFTGRDLDAYFHLHVIQGGLVYAIDEGDDDSPVKFGFCNDPRPKAATARLAGLQTGNARTLRLVKIYERGTREMERAIHRCLADERMAGEWFRRGERTRLVLESSPAVVRRVLGLTR